MRMIFSVINVIFKSSANILHVTQSHTHIGDSSLSELFLAFYRFYTRHVDMYVSLVSINTHLFVVAIMWFP